MTVILSLLLGFPAALALAKPGRLEKVLDPLIMLPLGSSAVMLGLGFIISFGALLVSPWMVPFAHTLVALPFVIRALQPAIASHSGAPATSRSVFGCLSARGMEKDRSTDPAPRHPDSCRFCLHHFTGRVWRHTLDLTPGLSNHPCGHRALSLPARWIELRPGDGDGNHSDGAYIDQHFAD